MDGNPGRSAHPLGLSAHPKLAAIIEPVGISRALLDAVLNLA